MSKIVRAINAMISQSQKIKEVYKGNGNRNELFFVFDDKYKWSIFQTYEGSYILFFYPGDISINFLANMQDFERQNLKDVVAYDEEDLATREASGSLKELYITVLEKLYNLDDVLNDIILTDDIPF